MNFNQSEGQQGYTSVMNMVGQHDYTSTLYTFFDVLRQSLFIYLHNILKKG